MNIRSCFGFIRDIRKAQKDVTTPVGACKSLQDHMDNEAKKDGLERSGIVAIGECTSDGYVLYAAFPNRIVPKKWHGFTVIDTFGE